MAQDFVDHTDRRGFLECMGWAGTGALFALSGGIASSTMIESAIAAPRKAVLTSVAPFTFLQISDTHIGFKKPANMDVAATLRETIAKIKALPRQPDFIVHTGDITHLATPEQFDLAAQMLGEIGIPIHFVPGEHDIINGNDPRPYVDRFAKGSVGSGWHSFDVKGVHFIALVNVLQFVDSGVGALGAGQIDWLKKDLAGLSSSAPIVVLSHFPLWPLYPQWGWGTSDGAIALDLLRRFGSVTCLNGHIHQIAQKIEGHIVFHSARSTAYPQPAPGVGPGPGPLLVPAEQLRSTIGMTSLEVRGISTPIPITDVTLA